MSRIESYKARGREFALKGGLALSAAGLGLSLGAPAFSEGNPNQQEPDAKPYRLFVGGLARTEKVDPAPLSAKVLSPETGTVDIDGRVQIGVIAHDADDNVENFQILVNGVELIDDVSCQQSTSDTVSGPIYGPVICDATVQLKNGKQSIVMTAENGRGQTKIDIHEITVAQGLTSISLGDNLANPEAFEEGLTYKTITTPEEYAEIYKNIHGNEAEAPELKEGEMGFAAIYNKVGNSNPVLQLENVTFDENGDVGIRVSQYTAEPHVFPSHQAEKRSNYILGTLPNPQGEGQVKLSMQEIIIN